MNTVRKLLYLTALTAQVCTSCQKSGPQEIAVTGITLDKPTIELTEGESVSLTATIAPKDATNQKYSWSSSDESVASVSSGKVTALKAGTATITAKTDDGGKTATCSVTVKSKIVNVTGVSIDKTSLTLTEGQSEWLKVTILPENATNRSTSWSTSNAEIASVTNNGKVEAIKPGEAIISVTTADGGFKAECKVTVTAQYFPVTGVKVTDTKGEKSCSLKVGETVQLKVEIRPENASDKNYKWSASTDCASINENGLVTALKVGDCVIRANAADGQFGQYYVEIPRINVETFEIVDGTGMKEGEAAAGSKVQLFAIITPDDATQKNVEWSSKADDIASVDENGLVTLIKTGTATIHAVCNSTAIDRKEADYKFTVTVPKVTSIEVTPSSLVLEEGKTAKLTAKILPEAASFQGVKWSSSNPAVATVSEDGTVTAIKEGKAKIHAGALDGSGVGGSCELTVEPDKTLKGISISSEVMELQVGDEKTLIVSYNPTYAANKTVSWSSSNPAVASVSDGKVKGLSEGTAKITVTSQEGGFTASCAVTVRNALPAGTKVLCSDISDHLYLNGEIYDSYAAARFTVNGNDIFSYQYRAGVKKNKTKIFSYGDLQINYDNVVRLQAFGDKLYFLLEDREHTYSRLLIVDTKTQQQQSISFMEESPKWLAMKSMAVSNDGTAYITAYYQDVYNEYSSRMWKVKTDGTSEQTIFFTAQKSANDIYDTVACDVALNEEGDVFVLVSNRASKLDYMVLFKNGIKMRTYNNFLNVNPHCITCNGSNVYAMMKSTDSGKCCIFKDDDILFQNLEVSAANPKSIAVDKNSGDVYYFAKDGDKYCIFKNGSKLYSFDNMVGGIELMY